MDFIEILKAIFIGIVEGFTEWLPISSTGHIILTDKFIQLQQKDDFKEMFLVVIQLGAIMAVLVLYFNKLNPFSSKKTSSERKKTISLWSKVIVACLPVIAIALPFEDKINKLFYNHIVVIITLIFYGFLFIFIEIKNKDKSSQINNYEELTYKIALLIGIFQILSLIPGTSRSGATILGAMLIGSTRKIAAEFSFFLAIPIMFGASALKLMKFGFDFTSEEITILIFGMITAFVTSLVAIKFLVGYIKNNDFKVFGYYRIFLGIVLTLYFLIASF